MSELFGRAWSVQVGLAGQETTDWGGLRTRFRVVKTTKREPNKCTVSVWNVNDSSIARAQEKGAVLRLLAGYGVPQTIFLGDVDLVEVGYEGPDRIIRIEAQDGARRFRRATLDRSYAADTPLDEIFNDLFDALGLPRGNVQIPSQRLASSFTAAGFTRDILDRLSASYGLEWFLLDGALEIFPAETAASVGPLISADTGMVGSPERWTDEKDQDGVQVRSLMQPQMQPGSRFELRSRQFTGIYRAIEVEHTGDTHGNDWYTAIRATLT